MTLAAPYSNSAINRAGNTIGEFIRCTQLLPPDVVENAYQIVHWFRQEHQAPLGTVVRLCRRAAKHEGFRSHVVSQRLKRVRSIDRKMAAPNGPRLVTLQDIAGCRLVLPEIGDVDRVHMRLQNTLQIVKTKDTRTHPGTYRALHLVCSHADRLVEIQLRTALQHDWASDVEWLDQQLNTDLKHWKVPPGLEAVYGYIVASSEAGAAAEFGATSTYDPDRLHNAVTDIKAFLSSRGIQ